jgi:O-antigen/teichoic acid export membrane protein
VIGVVVGLALLQLPLTFFAKASRISFLIATAWVPCQILDLSLQGALAGAKRFVQCGVCSVAGVFIQVVGALVLVGHFRFEAAGAVLSGLLGTGISVTIALGFLVFQDDVRWNTPSWTEVWGLIHYGMRYWLAELMNLLHVQAAPLFLGIFAAESEIGIFAVGFGLVMRVTMIPDMVTSVVQPRVAEDAKGRPELVTQSARIVGLLCCIVLFFMMLFARPLVAVLFSPRFLAAVSVIWVLAPGVAVRCATKLILPYLNGTNRPGIQSFSTIAALSADFLGLTMLYPHFGLLGASISGSISHMVAGAVLLIAFHKFSRSRITNWLPRRSDLLYLEKGFRTVWVGLAKMACL